MKNLLLILLLAIIVLLETSVLPFFPIFGNQPSLLLISLLALQFLGLARESYYGAFFGGILFDLLSSTIFGLSSLILLLLSGAVGLARRFAGNSPLILLLITFTASISFRVAQVFPTLNVVSFFRGGLLDTGLMIILYPTLRYLLKSVFGRRELKVGA